MFTFRKKSGYPSLASLAGLSQFHFIRAFKHSSWTFALSVRPIQSGSVVAKENCCSKRDLSIADVALAVGFSDASQLNLACAPKKLDWSYANVAFRPLRENGLR